MCFFLPLLRISLIEDKRRPIHFSLSCVLICAFENYLHFPVPLKTAAIRFVVLNFECIAVHAKEIIWCIILQTSMLIQTKINSELPNKTNNLNRLIFSL